MISVRGDRRSRRFELPASRACRRSGASGCPARNWSRRSPTNTASSTRSPPTRSGSPPAATTTSTDAAIQRSAASHAHHASTRSTCLPARAGCEAMPGQMRRISLTVFGSPVDVLHPYRGQCVQGPLVIERDVFLWPATWARSTLCTRSARATGGRSGPSSRSSPAAPGSRSPGREPRRAAQSGPDPRPVLPAGPPVRSGDRG